MLADITQGFDVGYFAQPVVVVEQDMGWAIETAEHGVVDRALRINIVLDHLFGHHLALGGLARGVADQTSPAAHDNDGGMPGPFDMG